MRRQVEHAKAATGLVDVLLGGAPAPGGTAAALGARGRVLSCVGRDELRATHKVRALMLASGGVLHLGHTYAADFFGDHVPACLERVYVRTRPRNPVDQSAIEGKRNIVSVTHLLRDHL